MSRHWRNVRTKDGFAVNASGPDRACRHEQGECNRSFQHHCFISPIESNGRACGPVSSMLSLNAAIIVTSTWVSCATTLDARVSGNRRGFAQSCQITPQQSKVVADMCLLLTTVQHLNFGACAAAQPLGA